MNSPTRRIRSFAPLVVHIYTYASKRDTYLFTLGGGVSIVKRLLRSVRVYKNVTRFSVSAATCGRSLSGPCVVRTYILLLCIRVSYTKARAAARGSSDLYSRVVCVCVYGMYGHRRRSRYGSPTVMYLDPREMSATLSVRRDRTAGVFSSARHVPCVPARQPAESPYVIENRPISLVTPRVIVSFTRERV